jgi:hypothetical protein
LDVASAAVVNPGTSARMETSRKKREQEADIRKKKLAESFGLNARWAG